jgi:hypothetical protein
MFNRKFMVRWLGVVCLAIVLLTLVAVTTASAFNPDTLVSVGSPTTPFSQNKQNEPALAVDANHPNILVAGSNDEIDEEGCNVGDDTTCPFTDGVGVSGVYFSFDSGTTWMQPTYTGWTARDCIGVAGTSTDTCSAHFGPIGTLPWYYENGLVSDGDPAIAFGPRRGTDGKFAWTNGSRLYFANLTSNFGATKRDETFKGYEAIAVSRMDAPATGLTPAIAMNKNSWMPPVLISKQSSTTFSDKEQIWVDNAATSPFFGNVYVCWASFRSNSQGQALPTPLIVARSTDGGETWTVKQVSPATDNSQASQADGCTIRTDNHGTVYVFGIGTPNGTKTTGEVMYRSFDGGEHFDGLTFVQPANQPGAFDRVLGRPTIDGIAGARSDLAPAPSVDIANGAPTGNGATNRIVMTYVSGSLAMPHVYFTESTDGGNTWSAPRAIETAGDRGLYTAPAISPNGTDVYVVYNAFTTPFRNNTTDPRTLVGVVLHADVTGASTGAFTTLHRSPGGDPRGSSQNNLVGEFLGDYVYAVATRTYGAAVWNDTRNAADCPAIDAWRASLRTGGSVPRPAPQQQCPATFGNSDIFGGSFLDPTP